MGFRKAVRGSVAMLAVIVVAGCGSVGDDDGGGGSGSGGKITVGLVIPESGVYAPLGEDMRAGWELYLKKHDNKLGGREVETVRVDEGETPDVGVPAVQKLLQDEDVDVLVGLVNSATALGAADAVEQAEKVLVIANAGADDLSGANDFIWRTSFSNGQVGYAIGKWAAGTPEGKKGAYAISADYAAGEEHANGFIKGFEEGGGKIVGSARTPFGTTQDFQPYLGKIPNSGAGLTYAFYAGGEAVSFVKQYAEFGVKDSIPLVGSGFLTEGGVLVAQGAAAEGIKTSQSYAPALDNAANKSFAAAYEKAAKRPPTVYAVQTWDAALVLDEAIQAAGTAEGPELAKALGELGKIKDSPRGPWSFKDQSPEQIMYLRDVVGSGKAQTNKVLKSLGTVPPNP
jgi:branched-chain amino acid transport system substrate-binding protein